METRARGTRVNGTVFAAEDGYAAFPCLMRTEHDLIAEFLYQPLGPLRESKLHPHYAPVMQRRAAVSRDGGANWAPADNPWPLREPLAATTRGDYYAAAVLPDRSLYTMTQLHVPGTTDEFIYAHRLRRTPSGDIAWERPMTERGPLERFNPFSLARAADGSLLAGGYWYESEKKGMSCVFLRSLDDGVSWTYLSKIESPGPFGVGEPGLAVLKDGRILAVLRAEWSSVKGLDPAGWPEDVNGHGFERGGYGYYLYQAESADNGRTWSVPRRLPLWGHPGFPLALRSGNVLLVWGHRRKPYGIQAALSRDGGRNWDAPRILRVFEPGHYDIGYPVALQLDDGSICCLYYGYSAKDTGSYSPHGIFASVFDEDWLLKGET